MFTNIGSWYIGNLGWESNYWGLAEDLLTSNKEISS